MCEEDNRVEIAYFTHSVWRRPKEFDIALSSHFLFFYSSNLELDFHQKAMEECLADAELRKRRQELADIKREGLDKEYVGKFAQKIREIFPGCPANEEIKIAEYSCQKYSDRVGRSAMAKELDQEAIILAVRAHIRHQYTNYDELLFKLQNRSLARNEVADQVEKIIDKWFVLTF
ncbi:MAG: DUF2293 domain-containing protein [Elusimicrobiota bacterium]